MAEHIRWDSAGGPPAIEPICYRCAHPRNNHMGNTPNTVKKPCTVWAATIPGLPDAQPCGCPNYQPDDPTEATP